MGALVKQDGFNGLLVGLSGLARTQTRRSGAGARNSLDRMNADCAALGVTGILHLRAND
jgi:hypothetical protein